MNRDVLSATQLHGVKLSGSILGLSDGDANLAVEELIRRGHGVHIDIIDKAYPGGDGVKRSVVCNLTSQQRQYSEIHLMVKSQVAWIPYDEFSRVIVHIRDVDDRDVINGISDACEKWISIEPQQWEPNELRAVIADTRAVGVLMMLVPPGARAPRAVLDYLDTPSWDAARALVPIGADGGVRPSQIGRLAEAGVKTVVVGRALLGNSNIAIDKA